VTGVTFTVPPEALDEIARRAAEIVLAELERRDAERAADQGSSPWLSIPEAAERLRCKPQRIYEMRTDGRLTRYKEGGRAVVSRVEVESLVKSI
jgi:excisionase family DNA binding protein